LVDDSHLSVLSGRSEYLIYTDGENIEKIKSSHVFKKLVNAIPVKFLIFSKPSGNGYDWRYHIQGFQSKTSARYALEHDAYLSIQCADTIYCKGFFQRTLALLNQGHDGVFCNAMRTGYEGISGFLKEIDGAPDSDLFFDLAFANQHPLWMSMNWNTPFFSKMPYHLIWNDHQTLVVRGFSVSAAVYLPTPEMCERGGSSDVFVLPLLKRPYIATDWSELPWGGAEFLSCWYPSYSPYPASTLRVAQWAKKVILPQNITNLRYPTYFKKRSTPIPHNLLNVSSVVAEEIIATVNAFQ